MNVNRNVIYRDTNASTSVNEESGSNVEGDLQISNVSFIEPLVLINEQKTRKKSTWHKPETPYPRCQRIHKKIDRAFIRKWTAEIKEAGYAKCVIETCNFISSNLQGMQGHYKVCPGQPFFNLNLCEVCRCYLASSEELQCHEILCRKRNQKAKDCEGQCDKDHTKRSKKWEKEIKSTGKAVCGHNKCQFTATKLSEMVDHYCVCSENPDCKLFICINCGSSFHREEDFSTHKETCLVSEKDKKEEELNIRGIKRKMRNEECIIQPRPSLPKNQYLRRRSYNPQHKSFWQASFEKNKHIICMYQNCHFIAMSLEDMIYHFGYCNGDGSFAKFECPYCKGRVTSKEILAKHIEISHSSNHQLEKETECGDTTLEITIKEEPDLSDEEQSEALDEEGQSWLNTWQNEISQFGFTSCPRDKCDFSSSYVSELETHYKKCKGGADEALVSCHKCKKKLKTKESLALHLSSCKNRGGESVLDTDEPLRLSKTVPKGRLKMYRNPRKANSESKSGSPASAKSQIETETESQNESIVNVIPVSDESQNESVLDSTPRNTEVKNEVILDAAPQPKKRGRKPKSLSEQEIKEAQDLERHVKCGKCEFEGTYKLFNNHNLKKHVGLAWVEGEPPVDLSDEKEVIRLVKAAFKLTKSATCETCQVVKRSFMGFATHIQSCGKTAEERAALKVSCPHCSGKYQRYSLPVHIKIAHSTVESEGGSEGVEDLLGKRRSALKAVSKFHEVLKENEDEEKAKEYYLFEKGDTKLPTLSNKLSNSWYKLKRKNKKIPCNHPNCEHESNDVREARSHHFNCSQFPNRVYICKLCDFYSEIESETQNHIPTHPKIIRQRKAVENEGKSDEEGVVDDGDEEEAEEEDNAAMKSEDEDDLDDSSKKKTKKRPLKKTLEDEVKLKKAKNSQLEEIYDGDGGDELVLKRNFCRKENIDNIRGIHFYGFGLYMTYEEEKEQESKAESWEEFHTKLEDWHCVSEEVAECILPEVTESISVAFSNNSNSQSDWRRFKRFEGDIVEGVPIMFSGGSVIAVSWCKVSITRMIQKNVREYLAVSSADNVEVLTDMKERSNTSKMSFLQIWDCGVLGNARAKEKPKLALGIVQEGGEIWDLSWFPDDTAAEIPGDTLPRIGLLATACDDGVVRVWSICDPSKLPSEKGLPLYKTDPIVKLVIDEDLNDSCFRVSVGQNGVIAGGYANGVLAVWNLKNYSSPFCRKQNNCYVIQAHTVIQAHRTSITALTLCGGNSRYVSTGGLDRVMKLWDLQFPSVPVEQFTKELCLDNIWTRNWPAILSNFDEVLANNNKGVVRFIKDIMMDKHQSCVILENFCLSLSFNDWLNALCACNNNGDVKVRLLKNFIQNQKINEQTQTTISSLRLEKLSGCEKDEKDNSGDKAKSKPVCNMSRSFAEICSEFGVVIKDNAVKDKSKPKNTQIHQEEFPLKAVNKVGFTHSPIVSLHKETSRKVCFNPNFKSFTHIAVGYNLGLIRIQCLEELQSNKHLKFFIQKFEKEAL